jgi:hypothetical protein
MKSSPTRFRFSISRLMILVAASAGVFWVYRSVNPFAFFVLMGYGVVLISQALIYGQNLEKFPRRAWWMFVMTSLGSVLVFGIMAVTIVGTFGWFLRIVLALFVMPIVLGSGVAWIRGTNGRHRRSMAWALVLSFVALPMSMAFGDWPIRLAFRVSRPALDRLADRIEAGDPPRWPVRAGLIRVSGIARGHRHSANIALSIDADSDGNSWLVRSANPEIPLPIPGQVFISDKLSNDGRCKRKRGHCYIWTKNGKIG